MNILERTRALTKVAALAMAAALALPATEARAEYVGGGYLRVDSGCGAAGWPTGVEMLRARFNPSEIGGRYSDLVLDLAVGGTMIYRVRGPLDWWPRWHRARGHAVWGALYSGTPAPRLRLVQFMSATTGNASFPEHEQIRLSVQIRNFNGSSGCTVTAHMMLRDANATGLAF